MIRPWEKFTVAGGGQVNVEYIDVLRRSRGLMIAEIGTRQKYPAIGAYGSHEVLLLPTERTSKDSYDPEAGATPVMFPRALRGWDVIAPECGRYSLTVALYKPGRRRWPAMQERSAEWRVRQILGGEKA